MNWRLAILIPGMAAGLHGCATAVATGAATGAAIVHDRRTAGSVVDDEIIELKVFAAVRKDPGLSKNGHINATSYDGVVLLTGETPTAELRARAEQITRAIRKVRLVHNELTVAAPSSLLSRSSDSLITSKIKTRMLTVKNIDPLRVKVVTENGVVYLMGLVTKQEADLATRIARESGGVQRVVRLFQYLPGSA